MKKVFFFLLLFIGFKGAAQQGLNQLLAAGIADAQRFTRSYIAPVSEGAMHSITNGWYNTANVRKPLRFEISLIGNASLVTDENRHFILHTSDYEAIQFEDGSLYQSVATALGQNDPDVNVIVEYDTPFGTQQESITLPDGFGEFEVNAIPNAFLQASIGVFKGTEIKGRFFPKINYDGAETSFYGGAVQHEFTSWIPGSDILPIAVAGIVAYTHLDASYDFTENEVVEGENQVLQTNMDTWLFSAIVSTKLPYVNFYGGLGYIKGKATTDVTGTYHVQSGILQNQTIEDPFGFENEISGIRANLGLSLSFGLFKLNADYSFQQYNNISFGLTFGI